MTLKRVYGLYTILGVQLDVVHGPNFKVPWVLKKPATARSEHCSAWESNPRRWIQTSTHANVCFCKFGVLVVGVHREAYYLGSILRPLVLANSQRVWRESNSFSNWASKAGSHPVDIQVFAKYLGNLEGYPWILMGPLWDSITVPCRNCRVGDYYRLLQQFVLQAMQESSSLQLPIPSSL